MHEGIVLSISEKYVYAFFFRYCVVFRVDKAMKSCRHNKDTKDLQYGKTDIQIKPLLAFLAKGRCVQNMH